MKIKRFLCAVAAAGVLLTVGCQKDPSTSSLHDEYLVYTAHDAEADFSEVGTYYIPDSILLIGTYALDPNGQKIAKYWTDKDAVALSNRSAREMEGRGYGRLTDYDLKDTADAGFQVSYVEEASYFIGYNDPYWWGYYPYYWAPGYWGPWAGWYYPYTVYYGYTTGSLLVEMLDLNSTPGADRKLPVIWSCYISGLLHGNRSIDIKEASDGIVQAFVQSPYLKK